MKRLFIISSAIVAFSAVSVFANETPGVNNGQAQPGSGYTLAVQDTVPKKDTTKKKTDTTAYQLKQIK